MIIAVTGGTGFMGKRLIARHIAMGDEVRYLTRHSLEKAIAGATAIIGDLAVMNSLLPLVQGVDVLYHCAAELNDTTKMHNTNVVGTQNLLTAVGRISDSVTRPRWVQLSSTGVYGSKPAQDVNENTPIQPMNDYEISKAAADELVYKAMNAQSLHGVVLRPSNVYGVDMPNQSLFQLIKMIKRGLFFFIGERGAMVNYIHVDNVIDALILCGTATLPANGQTYIVSDTCTLEEFVAIITTALAIPYPKKRLPETLIRLAARLADYLPRFPLRSSRVDALTYRHRYQVHKIEAELSYRHTVSMSKGISELCKIKK